MREQKEKEIDGVIYKVTPLDPKKATKLLSRILKIVGKPISVFMGGAKSISDLKNGLGGDVIGKAMDILTQSLDEGEVEVILDRLAQSEIVYKNEDGEWKKVIDLNVHCSSKGIGHYLNVNRFIIEANYSDFLVGLVGKEK